MQSFFDFFNSYEISKFVLFNFSSDQFNPNSSKKRTFDLLPPVGFHKLLKPFFPMKFNITVPVKPYIKRFLENNYGNPVDFRNYPRENEMFKRMLKKPNLEKDHMYRKELCLHIHMIEIVISERDFYRHGWELSKTDIVSFGKHFEKNAKWLMRTVVSTYISFGIPINIAINKFQTRFQLEEEYWPFDSIKKDFFRFKINNEIDFNQYAYQHLEKLILLNMSNAGAITNHILKNHEKIWV